ncbi:MAG: UDP-N-acetylglucosamine--N-acetylmuramyl-(pentapeptide) pyrophosphoryl-undecaprenol N-acetylglucosamine transferase [Candidatus Binatia bacterium]|nr:MAG: UDP-N-acetylglucosamine--N-acetylmuramyl-(pentapeptide) pyrophosphoryl-undecaprenol N-acetylglucosamine transferase [Candidatus Binatia bacterium]
MVVAGGGTGGHIFPGLAVAEAVRERSGEVLFVGGGYGLEKKVVPAHGVPLATLPVRPLRGKGPRALLAFGVSFPYAVGRAWWELRRFDPDVVLGVGGYASVPVVVAARLRGVPVVLLEQNAVPGLATRVLSRWARVVCLAFSAARASLEGVPTELTGNPVRRFPVRPGPSPRTGFTLLVLGGSQGAHKINVAVREAARVLVREIRGFRLVHQTGEGDFSSVREAYRESGVEAKVVPFLEDMGDAYASADLVLCRAGATTLAELTVLGKPSILVPYPYAADDHQRANAEVLVRAGAAELILDRDLTPDRLVACVTGLASDPERLRSMAERALLLGRPDATERVVEVCERVARGADHVASVP